LSVAAGEEEEKEEKVRKLSLAGRTVNW